MRPGQAAPEFLSRGESTCPFLSGFNEAGAGCPGIQGGENIRPERGYRFNEAGAGCPGIQFQAKMWKKRVMLLQ